MFTGLVEEVGVVQDIVIKNKMWIITFNCNKIIEGISISDSIAVNGVCLTVKEFDKKSFKSDVMFETIKKTNIRFLKIGSIVNLERALKIGDKLGGHIVFGHVDGVGIIEEFKKEGNVIWISISATKEILKYIVYKGSVVIDGISLTVGYVDEEKFKISIIPHTGQETTLIKKNKKDLVNIECDIIGKYVERFLKFEDVEKKTKIDIAFLKNNGFI